MYLFGEHGKDRLHVYLISLSSREESSPPHVVKKERINCQIQDKDQKGNMLLKTSRTFSLLLARVRESVIIWATFDS